MRAMAWAAAALMFAFTTACKDRDRQDTASRIDNAAEVRGRLDRMVKELADLERNTKEGADAAHREAVAAARDAWRAVDRNVEGLGDATEANWDQLKRRVNESLDSADRALRALRSDAKPMGGTGSPS